MASANEITNSISTSGIEFNNFIINELLSHGEACLHSEQYENAIVFFQQVLQYNPNHFWANLGSAEAYRLKDDFTHALEHYERIIQNPEFNNNHHANAGIAQCYFKLEQDSLYTDIPAIRQGPFSDEEKNHFINHRYITPSSHLTLALDRFNRAVQCNPNYFEAQEGLAQCYFRFGRFDEAKSCFQAAIGIYKDEIMNWVGYQLSLEIIDGEEPEGYDEVGQIIQDFYDNLDESQKNKFIQLRGELYLIRSAYNQINAQRALKQNPLSLMASDDIVVKV